MKVQELSRTDQARKHLGCWQCYEVEKVSRERRHYGFEVSCRECGGTTHWQMPARAK